MNINNSFSKNGPIDETDLSPSAENRNVRRRLDPECLEATASEAQESKMEIHQGALQASKTWKEFVLEYREYPRNLQEYQAQRLARENLMQAVQELPPPPPLPFSVPVLLSRDEQTSILPEKFLLLFNKCEFMKRQIFSGMDQLEKDSLDLSEFEECHLEAAYKILEKSAITQEIFELGGLGGIRLVEFLCPKEEMVFKIEPSLFTSLQVTSLQEGDRPEEYQIHLPVSLNLEKAEVESLEALAYFPNMRTLNLKRCSSVRDFSPIASLTNLRSLNLSNTAFSNASLLSSLCHLQKLFLLGCPIQDLHPLVKVENGQTIPCLRELEVLDIGCTEISDISILPLMPIRQLNLRGASEEIDYRPLGALQLDWISLEDSGIEDLSVLVNSAQSLSYLSLRNCEYLRDFTPLNLLSNVRALNLSVTDIAQVAILQNMHLQELYLYGCEEIEDIDRLSNLTTLQRLDISRDTPTSLAFLLGNVHETSVLSLPRLNHLVVKRPEDGEERQRIEELRELGVTVEELARL